MEYTKVSRIYIEVDSHGTVIDRYENEPVMYDGGVLNSDIYDYVGMFASVERDILTIQYVWEDKKNHTQKYVFKTKHIKPGLSLIIIE